MISQELFESMMYSHNDLVGGGAVDDSEETDDDMPDLVDRDGTILPRERNRNHNNNGDAAGSNLPPVARSGGDGAGAGALQVNAADGSGSTDDDMPPLVPAAGSPDRGPIRRRTNPSRHAAATAGTAAAGRNRRGNTRRRRVAQRTGRGGSDSRSADEINEISPALFDLPNSGGGFVF